jgi:hypothetical protein
MLLSSASHLAITGREGYTSDLASEMHKISARRYGAVDINPITTILLGWVQRLVSGEGSF